MTRKLLEPDRYTTVKLKPNNEEQFKARYVAKGFSQVENVELPRNIFSHS